MIKNSSHLWGFWYDGNVDSLNQKDGTMSFFEQVNGKTVDEYVSDVANGKTPAIAVSRRDFNADQYKALCEAIRNSKAVNNVFLSDISDEAEIKMLFDAIAANGNIEKITLQNTPLGDKYVKEFADMYVKHPLLTGIFFKNANIGDEGAVALAHAVSQKTKAAEAEGVNGEAKLLKSIRLNQNHIKNDGAKALAEVLKDGKKLQVFIVAGNEIEDEGMFAVADALAVNDTVEKLDVSGNPFSPSGAAALVAVVRNKPSIKEYAGFEI